MTRWFVGSIALEAQYCRSVEVAAAVAVGLLKPTDAVHDKSACSERLLWLDMYAGSCCRCSTCTDVQMYLRYARSYAFA